MRTWLHITWIICMPLGLLAQDNLQIQFAYRGSTAAARLLPATQSMDCMKVELSLIYNAWVANRSLTYSSIRTFNRQQFITAQQVEEIIADLDDDNRLGVGQDFLVFGIGARFKMGKYDAAWSYTISDRLGVNARFPKTLAQFAWQGNKQFAGQRVDLSNTILTGLYFREFSLGFARTFFKGKNWDIRLGGSLNYYMGLSGLTSNGDDLFFTTGSNAEFVELEFNYDYQFAGLEDFKLFQPKGHGFGLNLGLTFNWKERFHFDFGVTDIGYIRFARNVNRIQEQGTVTFAGFTRKELVNPGAFVDSVLNILRPRAFPDQDFRVPVGTRFSFMASWDFGKNHRKHGRRTLYLFYLQGFRNGAGATPTPKFTMALHRLFWHHFHVSFSVGWGGFNDFAIGGLLGLEFRWIRFGLHSDDFTGLIMPERGTGAGGGFALQFFIR